MMPQLREKLSQLLEKKQILDEEILEISRQLDQLILSYYKDDFYNRKAN